VTRFWRTRKFLRSADNWRRGFAFGYVSRCRVCGHTAYLPEHPGHGIRRDEPPTEQVPGGGQDGC
jgi:hypothetical protein